MPQKTIRRGFIKTAAADADAVAMPGLVRAQAGAAARPNIVDIFTDQQFSGAMSCAGNTHLKTPAMDSLAASGVRFARAYCTTPQRSPSRASMLTGRMGHEHGVTVNEDCRNRLKQWLAAADDPFME